MNAKDAVRPHSFLIVASNLLHQATWLKTLLLSGSHPETYETIIPADVLAQVSFGRTVAVGTAYVHRFATTHHSN